MGSRFGCPVSILEDRMKILLATHGMMASGMKSSLEILMGKTSIEVFDAHLPGNMTSVEEKVESFLAGCRKEETKLLVSDLYGGSVCQSMSRYIDEENVFVITGVNLGLLLELSFATDGIKKNDIEKMIASARENMCLVELEKIDKEEDFF